MKIEIITTHDSQDCDCCGTSFAQGGSVYIDGELVLDRPAQATCVGGTAFEPSDLLVMALAKLGHTVTVDHHAYEVCCHDDDYHGPLTAP